MFTKPYPSSPYTIVHAPATWIEDFSRKILERHLEKIQKGTLQIIYPDGICRTFRGQYDHDSVRAMINIKSPRFFRKLIFGGDVGFGESFMLGDWESDDLVGLLSLLISNRDYIDPRLIRFNAISRRINTLLHRLRKNTPFGSKKNIQAHYDLSNDMFKGFLDRTMSYSCAIFKSDSESLEDAQLNKINRILEQAELKADDHVLEIGCGWGSLAIEGVKKSGCRFTCLTLSEEQKEYAEDIIRREGLSDKITVKLCDYRAIDGQFDKIISIEMVEAVGREYLSEYFRICEGLLKPGGKIVIQAITLDNERISQYQKNCDWIQKYIFPGCFVPSLEMLQSTVNSSTRLKISDAYEMRGQYEKTLERWRKEFSIAIDQIKSFGFDMTFIRKWIYYFSYCQAGFTSRALSTYQMTLQKN